MATEDYTAAVNAQYATGNLSERILSGLRAAGKDPDALTPVDLAPVDQFHTGGRDATLRLAERAGLRAEMRVLDVGGGVGGPARTLAAEISCAVTVLDLTEEFCRVGTMLTERTALTDRATFRHGDALAMPFPDGSFDLVWTQHATMNIPHKARLFAEIARVLRPGGRFAFHEIFAGPVQPPTFPLPWARDPAASFLLPPDEVRAILDANGFREVFWEDETAPAIGWFREAGRRAAEHGLPPLGLHLLLGDDFGPRFGNVLPDLEQGRLMIVQGVFDRA